MPTSTLAEVLRDIRDGKITRKTAAALLGFSERHVNRLMKAQGVARPPGKRSVRDTAAKQRKQLLKGLAEQVLQEQRSIEQAAQLGDCSTRTMYRWVKKVAHDQVRKRGPAQ
jgi:predicted transcriptional regulator YheO